MKKHEKCATVFCNEPAESWAVYHGRHYCAECYEQIVYDRAWNIKTIRERRLHPHWSRIKNALTIAGIITAIIFVIAVIKELTK